MKRLHIIICALFLLVSWTATGLASSDSLSSMLRDDDDFSDAVKTLDAMDPPRVDRHPESHQWELSFTPAYSVLLNSNYQGISYSNGIMLQAALFYQVQRYLEVGFQGGYSFNHYQQYDNMDFFGYDLYYENDMEIRDATPEIRVGSWIHSSKVKWRPYVEFGAGWYEVYQNYDLKFAGNQFQLHLLLAQATNDFLGANGGAGVDLEVYPQSVFGLHLSYQRVFSSPSNIQLFTPGVQFSYLF